MKRNRIGCIALDCKQRRRSEQEKLQFDFDLPDGLFNLLTQGSVTLCRLPIVFHMREMLASKKGSGSQGRTSAATLEWDNDTILNEIYDTFTLYMHHRGGPEGILHRFDHLCVLCPTLRCWGTLLLCIRQRWTH